jgi:hypothetical protein
MILMLSETEVVTERPSRCTGSSSRYARIRPHARQTRWLGNLVTVRPSSLRTVRVPMVSRGSAGFPAARGGPRMRRRPFEEEEFTIEGDFMAQEIYVHRKPGQYTIEDDRYVQENIIEAVKSGVNNYIVKPFTAETLSQKINQIFNK